MLAIALSTLLALETLPEHFIDNHPILQHTWWGEFISEFKEKMNSFPLQPNWDNLLYRKRCFSSEEVIRLADNDQNISYFFWVTGLVEVVQDSDGVDHTLIYGDCLFFTGDLPAWAESRKSIVYYRVSEN